MEPLPNRDLRERAPKDIENPSNCIVKWRPGSEAASVTSNAATAGTVPASTAPKTPESGPDTASWPTTWSRSGPGRTTGNATGQSTCPASRMAIRSAPAPIQESPECHRRAQRGDQRVLSVGGTECEQDFQLGAQAGIADRGSTDQKRCGVLAERAELLLYLVFGRGPRLGAGRGPSCPSRIDAVPDPPRGLCGI